MQPTYLRIAAATGALCLLVAANYTIHSPRVMSQTANALLASLSKDQLAKATFDFSNEERFNWHFIPRPRKGLSFKDMGPEQRRLAEALLSAGLSQQGYIKATSIMSLEEILKVMEKNDPPGKRDPENYFYSFFGTPSETGTWGYRVEGHHLSLNFTVANGKVSGSPTFFGTNPAEVKEGPRKGLRVLADEEDLGRGLLMSLTPEQRNVAIVDKEALKDIITMASRKAALSGQPNGLSAAKMNSKQRENLQNLIEEYIYNVPEQIAQVRLDQMRKAGNNINFAWTGVAEKGGPHYYRVQAPTFLIEYDNTQNGANHVHSVWRDYDGDFGLDILGEHYKASH